MVSLLISREFFEFQVLYVLEIVAHTYFLVALVLQIT